MVAVAGMSTNAQPTVSACLPVPHGLTYHDRSSYPSRNQVSAIKISSKVDEKVWNDLKELADETHQNVSGLLTEAIRDYVQRRRVRPEVLKHLERSMDENDELGRLLAQ
jgi:predicted transcriptional regulator